MKIGIYFTASKNNGGVYQYSLAFLKTLASLPLHSYYIITTSPDLPTEYLHNPRFTIIDLAPQTLSDPTSSSKLISQVISLVMRLLYIFQLSFLIKLATRYSNRKTIAAIDALSLDLLIFPAGTDLSYVVNVPTIVAVHDLQHRLHREFPELSAHGKFGYRENYYRQTCTHAVKIMVDSQVGKEDVIACYPSIDPNKIVILPFLSPPYLNPSISSSSANKYLQPYQLAKPFIYYPAQFWPHKNHLNLIEAVRILHARGHKIGLALTGSTKVDFSTYLSVLAKIKEYKLSKYIKYLGYVENKVVSALYKNSLAMVMPTYMGPTNIPVLEAWVMGTPVITSDIRGCREQAKGAAILADPYDPSSIADAIESLLKDPLIRKELIASGHKRINAWTYADFTQQVKEMIKTCQKS